MQNEIVVRHTSAQVYESSLSNSASFHLRRICTRKVYFPKN